MSYSDLPETYLKEINEKIKQFAEPKQDTASRYYIAEDLIDHGPVVVEPLAPLLKHRDREIRGIAMYIIGKVADLEHLDLIRDKLEDVDENVRINAIEALFIISTRNSIKGNSPTLDAIIEMLKDSSVEVRMKTVEVLQWFTDEKVIPTLEQVHLYDTGVDKEGRSIKDWAAKVIRVIKRKISWESYWGS